MFNFRKIISAAVSAIVMLSVAAGLGIAFPEAVEPAFADVQSEGFVITDYDVNMDVDEDLTCHITETINCNFSQQKHGIFRCIPTSMQIARADGSTGHVIARVKNFDANTPWEKDEEHECSGDAAGYYTVRLGDEDREVIGARKYVISYDYLLSSDGLTDCDEFYFNIIGTGWDTDIEQVTFTVNMPKKFEADAVGFSMGDAGITGTEAGQLATEIKDRTITGKTLQALAPGQALTLRMELEEGYFTAGETGRGFLPFYLLPVLFALVSIFLCIRWGRDDKIIPVVQFGAPEGYNSLDVGVMHHLDVRNDDVLSLLIYLADKGYITIEPLPDKHGKVSEKPKKYRFHKVREYDGDNACEREFMYGLFHGASSVNSEDLEDEFYETVKAVKELESSFTSDLVSRKGRLHILIMALAAYAFMCIPAMAYDGFSEFAILTGFGWAGFIMAMLFAPSSASKPGRKILGAAGMIITILVLMGGIPVLFMADYFLAMTPLVGIGFAAGVVCMFIMAVCWQLIQKRTAKGVELGGIAMGLAEFIETAEKDRLEQMVEEDPQSFYRIIPYAAALGISDKWISRFKGITLEKPHWYDGATPYMEAYMIGHMLNVGLGDVMGKVSAAAASAGGGGISGGGVGGGGGGSW